LAAVTASLATITASVNLAWTSRHALISDRNSDVSIIEVDKINGWVGGVEELRFASQTTKDLDGGTYHHLEAVLADATGRSGTLELEVPKELLTW
jgi:hypothetical protein